MSHGQHNMYKGRKIIRNILFRNAEPLWDVLKKFKFVVAQLPEGNVVQLVAYDKCSSPYSTWNEAVEDDAVSLGTYYYGATSGQRRIDVVASPHVYELWDTPLFDGVRFISALLSPTISVGGPRPIRLPSKSVQDMNAQGHPVRTKPYIPNWAIPFIYVSDALTTIRQGRIDEYVWDYDAFPDMFYARVHGSEKDLDLLSAVCDDAGLLCGFRNQTDQEYENSMVSPGPKSAKRYAIVTNMILDLHPVTPRHVAHILRLARM